MKLASLLVALLAAGLAPHGLRAQDVPQIAGPGRISGTVVDPESSPLANVAITLRTAADSAVITGVMTDSQGRFTLESLPLGEYRIRVSFIGFRPRESETITLSAGSPAVDLGRIALEVSAVELDAVVAAAERSGVVIEPDRTVYATASMPVADAGTGVDVLRAVPELEVDVENNVKLRGNRPVAVHINGRPAPLRGEQLANFLEQLPGNRIERVEVMPNPSARHDPEGLGGIVNIVLKDDLDLGLSGSLSAHASTRNRQFLNGRLNYQRGRLTLFAGGGLNRYDVEFSSYDRRENLLAEPVTIIEQSSTRDNRSRGWNLDWTAELKVGRQATLWSNAWMYSSTAGGGGVTDYGIFDNGNVELDRYDRASDESQGWHSYNLGAGFKQVFEQQKRELTVDARWTDGGHESRMYMTRHMYVQDGARVTLPDEVRDNDQDVGDGQLSLQADYFTPLFGGRLDIGYKAWRREQSGDNRMLVFATPEDEDPANSIFTGFEFEEIFHSLYWTWGRTFGEIGIQGGLRAERAETEFHSLVTGDEFDRPYNTLFPSANVSWTPKPGRTIRLLYSKRISRPHPYYLDPAIPVTDPLNIYMGNPDLRPSYTQSITLDGTITGKYGTLRIAPYYRYSTDVWERIRTVDEDGVATTRWENAASSKAYGSSFTISLPPSGRVTGSTSFSVYRDERDGTNIAGQQRRAAFLWSLGGNLGMKLRESLTSQIYANYFPEQSILQGRASGYLFTSISLRQQLFDNKGSISLSISDPLDLYSYDSTTRDATHVQVSRSSYTSRMVSVGITFSFGKPPEQQSRRTAPDQQQEQGETIRVR